jgi:AAA domain
MAAAPSSANTAYFGAIARELAERRRVIEHAERLRQMALNPGADIADVRALAAGGAHTGSAGVPGLPRVTRLADVEPERIEWLWRGYLPLGKPVVIDGDPGVGKSTVCLDLAARVTTGSPMPDGSPGVKGTVLVLSAEDGVADTIRPRLDAARADPAQVITVTQIGEGPSARPLVIPGDLPAIEAVVTAHEVKLVIVDVLMAYLAGDVNAHRDQDVRRALHVLSAMAERAGCCVLILRHLNKSGGGNAVYRGGGSIGIIGAARAGFMCGRDPDDESGARRIFANVKMNIAAEPPSLAYTLAYDELHDVGRVQWLGGSEHRAGDLLAEPDGQEDRSDREAAAGWLAGYLTDLGGEDPAKDVKKAGRAAGFSERTLDRARKRAGVTTGRSGFGKGAVYVWRLDLACSPHVRHARQGQEAGEHGMHGGEHGEDANAASAGELGTAGTVGELWPEGSYGEAAS